MTWIALRYRGGEYSARDLIDIANRFLEDTGYDFVKYEIYDDCDLLMITGQNAAGEEQDFELSLDELGQYQG
ncbi:MAG: hypothetical protein MR431_00910 [Clostridia bacterium]|nr:hypothetical protein [Clostridia bacterium]MDD7672770.1 hypothetical protein [Clostridia bacterium]MDY2928730.1 hypothetical protein [Clostridiaceae bacterium]